MSNDVEILYDNDGNRVGTILSSNVDYFSSKFFDESIEDNNVKSDLGNNLEDSNLDVFETIKGRKYYLELIPLQDISESDLSFLVHYLNSFQIDGFFIKKLSSLLDRYDFIQEYRSYRLYNWCSGKKDLQIHLFKNSVQLRYVKMTMPIPDTIKLVDGDLQLYRRVYLNKVKRGKIVEFTNYALKNMMHDLLNLPYIPKELHTLTIPEGIEKIFPFIDGKFIKKVLNDNLKYFYRKYDGLVKWGLEFMHNDQPHFHLLVNFETSYVQKIEYSMTWYKALLAPAFNEFRFLKEIYNMGAWFLRLRLPKERAKGKRDNTFWYLNKLKQVLVGAIPVDPKVVEHVKAFFYFYNESINLNGKQVTDKVLKLGFDFIKTGTNCNNRIKDYVGYFQKYFAKKEQKIMPERWQGIGQFHGCWGFKVPKDGVQISSDFFRLVRKLLRGREHKNILKSQRIIKDLLSGQGKEYMVGKYRKITQDFVDRELRIQYAIKSRSEKRLKTVGKLFLGKEKFVVYQKDEVELKQQIWKTKKLLRDRERLFDSELERWNDSDCLRLVKELDKLQDSLKKIINFPIGWVKGKLFKLKQQLLECSFKTKMFKTILSKVIEYSNALWHHTSNREANRVIRRKIDFCDLFWNREFPNMAPVLEIFKRASSLRDMPF